MHRVDTLDYSPALHIHCIPPLNTHFYIKAERYLKGPGNDTRTVADDRADEVIPVRGVWLAKLQYSWMVVEGVTTHTTRTVAPPSTKLLRA